MLFFSLILQTFGQIYDNRIALSKDDLYAKDSLFLRIKNINFFKNNEYFGKFAKGYTNIGSIIAPMLVYYPSERSIIKAGVQILTYSGEERINKITPIFSFTTKLTEYLQVTIGTLNSDYNHKLSEPMLQFDTFYNKNTEVGIQFRLNKSWIESDMWLNWEDYIFRGDTTQEKFICGNSTVFNIIEKDNYKIRIPAQLTFYHIGGQINESTKGVQTFINSYLALYTEYNFNSKDIVAFEGGKYGSKYQVGEGLVPFKKGHATYLRAMYKRYCFEASIGYWHGNRYYSPVGDLLFSNISFHDPSGSLNHRDMITNKVLYCKELSHGIHFETRFESYMDLNYKNFDYSFTFSLYFAQDFFLKKVKSKIQLYK